MPDIPDRWAKAMLKADIGDPRNGKPSMRALADASGLSPETVRRVVHGLSEPSGEVVQRLADALHVDTRTLGKWVGQVRAVRPPFEPHRDANLMTTEEREQVNKLIGLLTRNRRIGVNGSES